MGQDISKQKQREDRPPEYRAFLEKQLQERIAVLAEINRIFHQALVCVTEEQLGQVCLTAAKKLTGSQFGFIGEVDRAGIFHTLAGNLPGRTSCEWPPAETRPLRKESVASGVLKQVIKSGETLICNDPASHPHGAEFSHSHPAITSFLGVPLKLGGQTCGMIGLANRKGGYDEQIQKDVEALAVAVVEVLMRKRAEWKLAQFRRHHELILSSASEGILGLDHDGNMTFVNPAAAAMLGYEVEELLGRNAHAVWHHSKPDGSPYPQEECPILEALGEGVRFPFDDDWFWRKDGTGFPARCSRNPIIQNDQISGAVVTFQDITARKQAEEALRRSEETYRQIVETASEGIWTMDAANRVTFANSRIMEMLGYSLDEVIGEPISKFLDREWLEKASTLITDHLRKGVKEHLDFKFRHQDGRELWVIMTSSPIFDLQGRYAGSLGMITDITARKEAEEALRESEQRFRDITENAVEWIWEVDPEGKYTYSSPVVEELLGYTPEEVLGKHYYDFFLPEEREELKGAALAAFRAKRPFRDFLNRNLRKNGETIWLSTSGVPVLDDSGHLLGYRGADHDITARKQAEESLRESEAKYRLLVNQIPAVVFKGYADWSIDFFDNKVEAITGYSKADFDSRKRKWQELILPEDLEEAKLIFIKALKTDKSYVREYRIRRKDGEIRWIQNMGQIFCDAGGKIDYVSGIFFDTTDRKQVEEAMQQSEERFRCTFDQSPIGAAIVGLDFRFQRANAELCRITGYAEEELFARTFADITHPEDVAVSMEMAQRLAAGEIDHFAMEKRYLRKDGKTVWGRLSVRLIKDAAGRPLYYLPLILDITAHKQADENLRQSLSRLQTVMGEIVQAMALTVEVRDPYTAGHQRRVTKLALAIAREMGLSPDQHDAIWCAGTLHDLGKIYVPEGILNRPGDLSDLEHALIKTHSLKGYEILKPIQFPWPVARIVRQHHERLDGSGYPDGLQYGEILLEAKILAVADVVEAMASHRPYREALGIDAALEEVSRNRGILFDPGVVDACLTVFKEQKFKFS
ncbi:MAG: PAS domain S-box protein [Thermodesulfobacteriota bacterium]